MTELERKNLLHDGADGAELGLILMLALLLNMQLNHATVKLSGRQSRAG